MPTEAPPIHPEHDAIWAASQVLALFPVWGLALAHNIGDPPLTYRFVDTVFKRCGPKAFICAPVVTTVVGYGYLHAVSAATQRARAYSKEQGLTGPSQ